MSGADRGARDGVEGPVVVDPRVVDVLLRGQGRDGRVGFEPVTTTIIAAAAAAAVARYGPGVLDWAVEGFESFLGINSCSKDNQEKHRDRIEALIKSGAEGLRTIADGLAKGEMTGATGECKKYALKWAAKRMIELSKEAGQAVEDVKAMDTPATVSAAEARRQADAIAARRHDDQEACRAAVNDYLRSARPADWRVIAREVTPYCNRFQASTPGCDFPQDVLLIGAGQDGYCAATLSQQAEMRAVVARLTPQQREQLATLPIGMRAAAVRDMLMGGSANAIGPIDTDGGSVGWGLALLALLGGGLWWFKRKPAKTKEGR
ncbi:MAG: hypothetical protein H6701_05495 [Myxococcales bacterium]|nr:hypothetical protein [Myxococcales bacterium]